jgi:serine protease Do
MKTTAKSAVWVLIAVIACFIGVLAALRVDRWFNETASDGIVFRSSPAGGILADSELQGAPFDFRAAAKKLIPSIVSVDRLERIRNLFDESVRVAQTGEGSGVIISQDGYVLTNNHVVTGADVVQVRLSDDRTFRANVVGTDGRSDLALLKIDAKGLPAAELGVSSKLEIGEWVLAVGNPLGYANTVSAGVVSSLKRSLQTEGGLLVDAIQTDAAINQGNSGGALANSRGQVVGINSAIASTTGGSIGLGFAIPIDRAKRVVSDIMKFGRVKYGDLGAIPYGRPGLLYLDSAREQMRELTGAEPPRTGLVVRRVIPGTGAENAGMRELDVIFEVDGTSLEVPADLMKALMDRRAGDSVKVKFWSRGNIKTVTMRLQEIAY